MVVTKIHPKTREQQMRTSMEPWIINCSSNFTAWHYHERCTTLIWSSDTMCLRPSGRFLYTGALGWYEMNPKLNLCTRIRKLPCENMVISRCKPLHIKAATPGILLTSQIHQQSGVTYGCREKPVATASRWGGHLGVRHTSSTWGPVFVLYCVLNFIGHRDT